MMPIPLPATSHTASCALRRTGSGRTAGPAEKLKMRLLMGAPMCGLLCAVFRPLYLIPSAARDLSARFGHRRQGPSVAALPRDEVPRRSFPRPTSPHLPVHLVQLHADDVRISRL